MAEMSGGCITLTSLGHIGGTGFTPIVNAPEVAILGVSRARPVAQPGAGDGIAWKQMLPLSLSYDHRVINGADAARFCRFVAERLDAEDLFAE
jgi:pyruvate dehydrogenase E2 component (dihydrolipoamide acetyltransferase)